MPAGGQKNEHVQDISTVRTCIRRKFFIDKHFWQQKTYVCDSQKIKTTLTTKYILWHKELTPTSSSSSDS